MKKRIIALIFALLLIVFIPVYSHAEFGEFAGDSDYGYDSGGYDSGNDYNYNYGDDDDDDDNYYVYEKEEKTTRYYSSVSGSHSGSSGFGGHFDSKGNALSVVSIKNADDVEADYSTVLGAIIAGFIAIIVISVKRSKRGGTPTRNYSATPKPINPGAEPTRLDTLKQMSEYTANDPEFSETELKEKVSNMYIQMQNCWQKKNLEQLRPYFTDALYAQFDRQLEPYRTRHETNIVERIAVLGVAFNGWRTVGDNDEIIATVRTRIVDYTIDDKTQQVVRGDRNREKFMTYEWTLSRKSGVKTTTESGTRSISCPHCGAPLDINKSAKCEYCGSIVTVDSSDWLISEIKGIAQRTAK
ncbi:MAG: Tim44-like domain-containing protein [Clostridia bacterium]|nr:Tim44-like domain-containing protein [Clostridia bacterium]